MCVWAIRKGSIHSLSLIAVNYRIQQTHWLITDDWYDNNQASCDSRHGEKSGLKSGAICILLEPGFMRFGPWIIIVRFYRECCAFPFLPYYSLGISSFLCFGPKIPSLKIVFDLNIVKSADEILTKKICLNLFFPVLQLCYPHVWCFASFSMRSFFVVLFLCLLCVIDDLLEFQNHFQPNLQSTRSLATPEWIWINSLRSSTSSLRKGFNFR